MIEQSNPACQAVAGIIFDSPGVDMMRWFHALMPKEEIPAAGLLAALFYWLAGLMG